VRNENFPGLFISGSKVLVVGQNPGQPQNDLERAEIEQAWENNELHTLYKKWFKVCRFYRSLESYLGNNWLDSGNFSYMNVVPERTINNERPSQKLINKHAPFLFHKIREYEGIVMVGTVARDVILGHHHNTIFINHPASYTSASLREAQRIAIKDMLKNLGIIVY
jgi:uracil-DNA glycosylase